MPSLCFVPYSFEIDVHLFDQSHVNLRAFEQISAYNLLIFN